MKSLSGSTFRDVDLEVHAGEIVGIVGVHGSGREDVCRALFGAEPTLAGEVTLDGEKLDLSGTRGACRRPASATCPPSARSRAWSDRCRSPTT